MYADTDYLYSTVIVHTDEVVFQIYRAIDRSPPITPDPGLLFMASTLPLFLICFFLLIRVCRWMQGVVHKYKSSTGGEGNLISIGNCWSANTEESEYPFYSRRNRGSN